MRVLTVLSVLVLVAACSSPAPAPTAPAADAPQVKGNLNQVMRGILFPNSNILFDAQDKDPGAPPDPKDPTAAVHPFAGTYGGWEAVENASIALAEAANLVALPGRSCANGKPVPLTDPTFQKGLAALREVSMARLQDRAGEEAGRDARCRRQAHPGVRHLSRRVSGHRGRREAGGYRGSMRTQAISEPGTPLPRRSAEGAKAGA